VAGSGDETVVRLSLDGTPGKQAIIKTGFHTDNLRWGSDGFLYASGQRDTVANLFACAPNTRQRCTSPFSVVRIDPATLQMQEVIHHPGGPSFGAASTALRRIGDEYWPLRRWRISVARSVSDRLVSGQARPPHLPPRHVRSLRADMRGWMTIYSRTTSG